jgi:hypothetical protein
LQRAHDLAVAVVHHARKHGGSTTGGESLRGSGDFFAWVDTALSLRRRPHQQLGLSVEHRAAAAPDPVTLVLTGTERDMHLALVVGDESPGADAVPTADLDAAILNALDHAAPRGLPRASLRAALHVRNERLGDALTRLAAAGHIARDGDTWVRRAVPVPALTHITSHHITHTRRNWNGNADGADG